MRGLERLPCFEQDDSLIRVGEWALGVKWGESQLLAFLEMGEGTSGAQELTSSLSDFFLRSA